MFFFPLLLGVSAGWAAFGLELCHKWNPFMINEVAIAMTFPSLLHRDGGRVHQEKKLPFTAVLRSVCHTRVPPPSCALSVMDPGDFLVANTFRSREEKGRG